MKDMLQLKSHRVRSNERNLYVRLEAFKQLFTEQKTELLRLSLHLTAEAEKAERCLTLARRDCLFRNTVSQDGVQIWARRMVIRNAICLVWGVRNDMAGESAFEFQLQPTQFPLKQLRESVSILTLPDLDRLAFVICILERYSILDCAFLLRSTPQEVYEAIVRANSVVVAMEQRDNREAATTDLQSNMYGGFWGQGNKLEDSCGSILD